eukprot:1636064-Prymnesium_polylepis.1
MVRAPRPTPPDKSLTEGRGSRCLEPRGDEGTPLDEPRLMSTPGGTGAGGGAVPSVDRSVDRLDEGAASATCRMNEGLNSTVATRRPQCTWRRRFQRAWRW